MGMREQVALLRLSSGCLVIVVWLFLAVQWVCLQFVVVVFPYHTHLLFCKIKPTDMRLGNFEVCIFNHNFCSNLVIQQCFKLCVWLGFF